MNELTVSVFPFRLKIDAEVDEQINWILYMSKTQPLSEYTVPHDLQIEERAIKTFGNHVCIHK